jgi:intraflagellar transport protein 172
MQKISSICWSPNSKRMAVATADRVIHLFDENGVRQDKFQTRPQDKDNKSYIVRAMAFSPDNQKLAVAQSDNIVFIYKLGLEWGEKKSICNKFA